MLNEALTQLENRIRRNTEVFRIEARKTGMEEQHRKDGDGAKPVDIGAIPVAAVC